MATTSVFSTFSKDFWWPSRVRGIRGRNLDWEYFWPHFENKMAATGISLSVKISAYISLIIGPRVLGM